MAFERNRLSRRFAIGHHANSRRSSFVHSSRDILTANTVPVPSFHISQESETLYCGQAKSSDYIFLSNANYRQQIISTILSNYP